MSYLFVAACVFFYVWMARFAARRKLHQSHPVNTFVLVFLNGYTCLNLVVSAFVETDVDLGPALVTYGIYLLVSCLMFGVLCHFSRTSRVAREAMLSERWTALAVAMSLPFAAIALKFFYLGYSSGAYFGSQAWRAAIVAQARGYEYLIYQSGALLLILIVAGRGRWGILRLASAASVAAALTAYGGRFLLLMAFLVGIYLLTVQGRIRLGPSRLMFSSIAGLALMILWAAYRYAFSEDADVSSDLVSSTVTRQLAGNVYDFALSYGHADKAVVANLIVQKLLTAVMPLIFSGAGGETVGSYLAFAAARPFEVGHRISAVGEVFYLADGFGVSMLAVLLPLLCLLLDRFMLRARIPLALSAVCCFVLGFAFFIDLSYLVTGIYLWAYAAGLFALVAAVRRTRSGAVHF